MVSSVKLAELWQRLGYRVVAVCMGKESRIDRVSDAFTVHYHKDIFLPDPWNYGICFGFAGYVLRLVRAEKPDVIVCNKILFWTSNALLLLRLTGHRVILLTDALVGMTWWGRGLPFRLASVFYAWTLGWLIMLCADRIVFFHPQPEKLLKILGVYKKSQIIPTGIDPTTYNSTSPNSFPERVALRGAGLASITSHDGITVTYIGRLESVKGADDFVEALVPLKVDCPNIKIQVVGWHKEGHPLVEKFKTQVEFTGLRKDIPEILSKTDIFVMPSYSEGLSNAIMEAMASGCACVVSRVGGNLFLIQEGETGLCFKPGDRDTLREHVRFLIEHPEKCKEFGKKARERIEDVFSWEKVGEEYKRLFALY